MMRAIRAGPLCGGAGGDAEGLTLGTRSGGERLDAQAGPGDQLPERRIDAGETLALGQLPGGRPGDDDDVLVGLQARLGLGERLTEQALDLVALYRSPHL